MFGEVNLTFSAHLLSHLESNMSDMFPFLSEGVALYSSISVTDCIYLLNLII